MEYRSQFKIKGLAWLFLSPTLFILIVFLYFPAWQSLLLSLYRSNLFLGTRSFIGLENFKNLFWGKLAPAYYQALWQTLLLSFLVIVIGLFVSLVLATLTNSLGKKGNWYRLLLIWPYALSPAVAGTILSFMFNPETGIVNEFLSFFSLQPRWLDKPFLAFSLVAVGSIWKNLGYNIVFYLAALQNIPPNNYEAATMDGAGSIKKFFHITLPLVSPVTYFLIFTNLTFVVFEAFGLIDLLTGGGPVGSPPFDKTGVTTVLIYKVFQDGFGGSSNMGFAAAQSVVLMFIVAFITWMQFRYEKHVHYGGGD